MSLSDQAVLDYIAANPGVGREDIRRHVAHDISDTTVWRALKRLIDDKTRFLVNPTGKFVVGGPDAAGPGGEVFGRSVNIGCVRLTERHLHADPPRPGEIADTTADIDAALDQAAASVPLAIGGAGAVSTLVGLAGSVTTVAAIALGLDGYDSARIHHSRVSAERVHEIAVELLGMTRAERAAIPVMHPGRVDVIGAGALILDRIMSRFGLAEVLVSEHDILDGIAWSLVP